MAFPNPIGSKIELNGVANYKAIAEQVANAEILKAVLDSFDLLSTKPAGWDSVVDWDDQDDYYAKGTDKFTALTGVVPVFDTTKFYFTASTGGTAIQTQPDDWDTNYKSYYVADTEDGVRSAVVSAAPTFVANTYYKKASN